jgi:alanyl-tRNA synthetase
LRKRICRSGAQTIPGEAAFDLYATDGFPRDLIELMAREHGLVVDASGWEKAETAHQQASKSEGKFKQLLSAEELETIAVSPSGISSGEALGAPTIVLSPQPTITNTEVPSAGTTRSTYHDEGTTSVETETEIVALFRDEGKPDRIVIAASPFYPEGGGQVGDCGVIEAVNGTFRFVVDDTRRVAGSVVQIGKAGGDAARGMRVRAKVDAARRERTRKNHTATHLLHKALKEVLGSHVGQQGSYVGPDRLRFDFAHPKAVTTDELERIERIVNERIYSNPIVTTTIEDLEAAKARGVVAMFGEKYDQRVRVLDVGGWSTELCGGTHVRTAGDIGPFFIVSERAIQAGVRRIEALTGPTAVDEIQRQRRLLRDASQCIKAPMDELPARITMLQEQLRDARKKVEAVSAIDWPSVVKEARAQLHEERGVLYGVYVNPNLDQKGINELLDKMKSQSSSLAVGLFGKQGDKVPWLVACTGEAPRLGLNANHYVPEIRQWLGGGGGGSPEKAQGQGLNLAGIPPSGQYLDQRFGEVLHGEASG